jgi:hypothetical protein
VFSDLDINGRVEVHLRSPIPVRWLSSAPREPHERPYTERVEGELIEHTETGIVVHPEGAASPGFVFIPWTNVAGVRQGR